MSEQVFTNLDLDSGLHNLNVTAPNDMPLGVNVAARFRWGTLGKTWFGSDIIGEVEDYLFETKAAALPGDYNLDDIVDDADYGIWKSTYGSTADLRADGNKNGIIDIADYTIWRNGKSSGGGSAALASIEPPEAESAAIAPLPETVSLSVGGNSVTDSAPVAEQVGGSGAFSTDPLPASAETSVANNLNRRFDLSELHFSASVGHAVEARAAWRQASSTVDRADLAMLLLASGNFQRLHNPSDDDSFAADVEQLGHDCEQDGDLDLVLAAAFEDEGDWRYAL